MDVQSSSALPLPPARFQAFSTYIHSFRPRRARFQWREFVTVAGILAFFVIVLSILGIFIYPRKKNTMHDCKVVFSVSKTENLNFRTISDAVNAAPNYSPFHVCIVIQRGEYNESVIIGPEKTNLILIGGGFNQTIITSNASYGHDSSASTLSVDGTGFMAQDLSIINTGYMGIAVDNSATNSIFFRCKFVGKRTLHVQKHKQFYRDCLLHGESHSILGDASAFFQKCQFFGENLFHKKEIIFSGHYNRVSFKKTGLIFHLCEFRIVGGSSTTPNVFLGNAVGSGASIVVMQCYLDEYLTGYFIENPIWNNTFFGIFGNHGPGATIKAPPFVRTLKYADASNFSLRSFFKEGNWEPPSTHRVEYDLDLGQ